ncbi:MerR family transcriptional regulator [Macrococcus brunensis]|uniref:MerR family transcriptional regulator n=1 Tax=Macrococcus brunensis TaxID=198483 RepID=UPI001EEFF9AC|nr:MerR family transcriptional regulator [Macrococcus brunensis]ULG72311.1 MerR family transcriptional regulator [Macrococcus brunensis]
MYTISELAALSGISTRTLRYYDEIDLLKPVHVTEAGYREYGTDEVDLLQRILFYRELDFSLNDIKNILIHEDTAVIQALEQQYEKLLEKRNRMNRLIHNIEQTIQHHKGEIDMTDQDKFEGFKKKQLEENEQRYGEEIREKYGEETVEKANQNWQHLSEQDYLKAQAAEDRLIENLNILLKQSRPDLSSSESEIVFKSHQEWLEIMAPFYSKEYHRNLGEMYLADERFGEYYNHKTEQPSVALLKAIIDKWTD